HVRNRRALQDTMTAIRHGIPIAQCGHRLFGNGERHLRSLEDLRAIYPPELIAESLAIADRCHFDLGKLNYQYPAELVPEGHTPTSWLKHLVEEDGKRRWPDGPPEFIAKRIGEELAIIAEMQCEAFFLTVHDIVRFARSRGIL